MTSRVFQTEPYREAIRYCKLWPPYAYAHYAQYLALLPRSDLRPEDLRLFESLAVEDWFLDGGQSCLLLGEAVLRPDGAYHAQDSYAVANVLALTLLHRRPQQKAKALADERKLREQEKDRQQRLRDEHYKRACEAERLEIQRRAALRSADPMKEIAALKERIAQLEAEKAVIVVSPAPTVAT